MIYLFLLKHIFQLSIESQFYKTNPNIVTNIVTNISKLFSLLQHTMLLRRLFFHFLIFDFFKKKGVTSIVVPPGSYLHNCNNISNNAASCQDFDLCPSGWYGSDPPTQTCQACQLGTTSFSGSVICRTCAKGKHNNVLGNEDGCSNCKIGKFQEQDQTPSIECNDCPKGYLQKESGQSFCLDVGWKKPIDCDDTQYLNSTNVNGELWVKKEELFEVQSIKKTENSRF